MGFLSNMLPTVIGVGVGAATGNPWLGAAAAGGLKYSQTGNLMQAGLAGLGGYGGAAMGQALAEQGMQQAVTEKAAEEMAAKNLAVSASPVGSLAPTSDFLTNGVVNESKLAAYGDALKNAGYGGAYETGTAGLTNLGKGIASLGQEGGMSNLYSGLGGGFKAASTLGMAAAPLLEQKPVAPPAPAGDANMGQRYTYSPTTTTPTPAPDVPGYDNLNQDFGKEQKYFTPAYTKVSEAEAKKIYGYAPGGVIPAVGGANINYPQSNIPQGQYANAWQTPVSRNMFSGSDTDTNTNQMTGEMLLSSGGISDLGGYSDGGRLLRGPGDGVSDSIPATIANKRPARLADGEFVVPARIVSELGNGSTDAGARELYKMMDRVQSARAKTTGKGKVAKKNSPQQMMPA